MMLSGEPYVLDYLRNIDAEVEASAGPGWHVSRVDLVPEHVTMWRLDRDEGDLRSSSDGEWGI